MSGFSSPQSHTPRCMSEKELALQFTGIVCVCCVTPTPLCCVCVTSSALGSRAPAVHGAAAARGRREIRGGAGTVSCQRPECHPGRCKLGRCERQSRGEGRGLCAAKFELVAPAAPAIAFYSPSLRRKDSQGWSPTLGLAPWSTPLIYCCYLFIYLCWSGSLAIFDLPCGAGCWKLPENVDLALSKAYQDRPAGRLEEEEEKPPCVCCPSSAASCRASCLPLSRPSPAFSCPVPVAPAVA